MKACLVIFFICAFGFLEGVQGLTCYDCGPQDKGCLNLNDTNIAEKKCNENTKQKCVSFFIKSDDVSKRGVYRDCLAVSDVKSSCDLAKEEFKKDGDEFINCFDCETDKCNSRVYKEDGTSAATKSQFMIGLILPLLSILLFKLH